MLPAICIIIMRSKISKLFLFRFLIRKNICIYFNCIFKTYFASSLECESEDFFLYLTVETINLIVKSLFIYSKNIFQPARIVWIYQQVLTFLYLFAHFFNNWSYVKDKFQWKSFREGSDFPFKFKSETFGVFYIIQYNMYFSKYIVVSWMYFMYVRMLAQSLVWL